MSNKAALVNTSIVATVYNCGRVLERFVELTYQVLKRRGQNFEIILVDDFSSDDSRLVAESLKKKYAEVRPFYLPHHIGQHAALFYGFCKSRGGQVVSIDSDMRDNPEDILPILECLESGFDLVHTRRFRPGHKKIDYSRQVIVHGLLFWPGRIAFHPGFGTFKGMNRYVVNEIISRKPRFFLIEEFLSGIDAEEAWLEIEKFIDKERESQYSIFILFWFGIKIFSWFSYVPAILFYFSLVALPLFLYSERPVLVAVSALTMVLALFFLRLRKGQAANRLIDEEIFKECANRVEL